MNASPSTKPPQPKPNANRRYAVRLVNACIREGLLTDVPARAWPEEARMERGKVIEFPGAKKTE